MMTKKWLKTSLKRVVFGCLFVIVGLLGLVSPVISSGEVWAVPETAVDGTESAETTEAIETNEATETANVGENNGVENENNNVTKTDGCKDSLGAIGWLVCPVTGKLAEAVDALYGKIEEFLVIDPISMEDGSPIYEIWKYCLGLTNVVFIIFLLVVIYSQLTGLGISNYGVKKVLPKLIVAAILVNLSFLVCSLAVDVSNVIGSGLTGLFKTIEQSAAGASEMEVTMGQAYGTVIGGGALAVGAGVVAFETGAIWMLIPVALGAIVAVLTGLFMIALRQAVVALLIMVAPLAIVAYILPNVDDMFKKWKKLFIRMLTFYPLFSLLFGASSLAGMAIMMSAQSGFGILLGIAVQIFPLFFSVSLMKFSGTFLSGIHSKVQGLTAKPLATNRAWADSHRQLAKQKHLASGRSYTPSMWLMNFMSNRKTAREEDTAEFAKTVKNRGLAYNARSHYKKDGRVSREGERAYKMQAMNIEYENEILRDKNNFNRGLGVVNGSLGLKGGEKLQARLDKLDARTVKAADALFVETARGEKIGYENAEGRHKRFEDAINAHFDIQNKYMRDENGNWALDENGNRVLNKEYRMHRMDDRGAAEARYSAMSKIMDGEATDVQYAAASAAHGYDTQKKMIETKYQKYFELAPPTRDVEYRLSELTKMKNAAEYIDAIIPGLRILNQRGDTDLVRKQLENVLNEGVKLGTHASQSLASFLMFEVKDNDPFLRRFGKYINLETAQVYNKNKRQNDTLTLNEYITGDYEEWEPGDPTKKKVGHSKRTAAVLLEGTSLDNVERTAFANLDEMLMNAYTKDGKLDEEKYFAKRNEIENAIGPAFISASLKYLSGSEQLKNAVSFLTGYDGDKPRWEDKNSLLYGSEAAEEYFREKSLKYIKDQTPSQILGMRSDYRDAMMEHLSTEYFKEHPEEKKEFDREVADIQTRYGDESKEEAQKKRKADINKLKMEKAGAQMRKILGETGKLEQIYRTRRSGAANNAKDWLRGMVNLDNENALQKEVEYYKKMRNQQEYTEERRGEADSNTEGAYRIYDEGDQIGFEATMSDLNDRYKDEDRETFFDKTVEQLNKWFPGDVIVEAYKEYYEKNPYATNSDLYDWIQDVLADLNRYPGNRDMQE